tara:strand:+ start:158 stop:340 length:183 start_codon:yes stop_codon:yes gene_type:complete
MRYKKFPDIKLGTCDECGIDVYRHDSYVVEEIMFPKIRKSFLCHNPRNESSCFTKHVRVD